MPNEVICVDDIVNIKVYSRYAILMPTLLADTVSCLGYEDASQEVLKPDNFNRIFLSINNNGRYWLTEVSESFKERLDAMEDLHDTYYAALEEALSIVNQMVGGEIPVSSENLVPVVSAIRAYWLALYDAEGRNHITLQKLDQFSGTAGNCSADIEKVMRYIDQESLNRVKTLLLGLKKDFDFISDFSVGLESAALPLWTEWTSLSKTLEEIKNEVQDLSPESDIAEFWYKLELACNQLKDVYSTTQRLSSTFQEADKRYEDEYPAGFVPLGAYLDDCNDLKIVLKGELRTASGSWTTDEVQIEQFDPMSSEIMNEDGSFRYYNQIPIKRGYSYFPGGNYAESGRSLQVFLAVTPTGGNSEIHYDLTNRLNVRLKLENGNLIPE